MIKLKTKNQINQKRQFKLFRLALLSLLFFLISTLSFAQDSISEKKDMSEEADLKFQNFFFKALTEKSIGNYQKALENLENCNQISENNSTVFFEFSKNYYFLNQLNLAKVYVEKALLTSPENIWMLKHLVQIHQKANHFSKAIEIQQQVAKLDLNERSFLIKLYLYNKDYSKAKNLMDLLEEEGALEADFKKIKSRLHKRSVTNTPPLKLNDIALLEKKFKEDKSYETLIQILKISENNIDNLLTYSEKGIALFPAQSYVYLMKAKALNSKKKFEEALVILNNGLDFVIEDAMAYSFYKEIAISYKGLGKLSEENKYLQKAKKLKS